MSAAVQIRREIPFNSSVLKWARELHGRSYEQAAKKAGVTADKIIAWEAGESSPTVRQARLLADEYDRPFLEFFSREIPDVPKPKLVPDFRLYHDAVRPGQNESLIEIQSWAETQRLNAIDLFEILGEALPAFPSGLFATINDKPDFIASRARDFLRFTMAEQMNLASAERDKLPKKLRAKFEAMGILVLKNSGLSNFGARGICIFAESLPVIVYGNEAPSAQAFTLVHEFAHIILKQSAVIGGRLDRQSQSTVAVVERWCNQFAAAFLIPSEILAQDLPAPARPENSISESALAALASRFGISRHTMLIRLVELRYVEPDYYWSVKRHQFIKEEDAFKGGGRAQYYGSRYLSSNGQLYTGLVLEAWTTGRITNHNAGEFMGIKNLVHLEAIRDHFGT
eukprot:gene18737-19041_t